MGDWADFEEWLEDSIHVFPKMKGQTNMAAKTKQKTEEKALVRKDPSEMERWEKDLYEDAVAAKEQNAGLVQGAGSSFSVRGGVLYFGGNAIPDNQIAVVILASVAVRTYYPDDFDDSDIKPPRCYAYSRNQNKEPFVPYKDVVDPISPTCLKCKFDAFKTDKRGKGKACRERIRLAVISAGTLEGSTFKRAVKPEELEKAEIAWFNVPTMSRKAYTTYVDGVKANFNRPPYAAYTKIKVVPDPKNQFTVEFMNLDVTDGPAVSAVLKSRARDAEEKIVFPFPSASSEAAPAAAPAGKAPRNKFK